MLTPEERALVTDIGDRLLDLYAQKDRARCQDDWNLVRKLQFEIDHAAAERREILQSTETD